MQVKLLSYERFDGRDFLHYIEDTMNLADEFINKGMDAVQTQKMGEFLAHVYAGALRATQDEEQARLVTEIFISGIFKSIVDNDDLS